MAQRNMCPRGRQLADQLVAHGQARGADVVSHALATLIVAREQGVSLDDLITGMLDADALLEGEPVPMRVPSSPPSRLAMARGADSV